MKLQTKYVQKTSQQRWDEKCKCYHVWLYKWSYFQFNIQQTLLVFLHTLLKMHSHISRSLLMLFLQSHSFMSLALCNVGSSFVGKTYRFDLQQSLTPNRITFPWHNITTIPTATVLFSNLCLSARQWVVLDWHDWCVVVSKLLNRALIVSKVMPVVVLAWEWQSLGVVLISVTASRANEPNLHSDKKRNPDDVVYCFASLISLTCKDFTRNSSLVLNR